MHKNQRGQRHSNASFDDVRAKPNSKARHPCRVEAFAKNTTPSFGTLACRLFRDGLQFCSGLVDLVVCVGRHGGGGHRLTVPGEQFVGVAAEDIAEVR